MKVVVFHEHGGPEVLKYQDAPEPEVGPGEVLVRVRACGINHLDIWTRMGIRGVPISMPHILGNDIAGEVAEVGPGVTNVRVGEGIVVAPGLSCGQCEYCLDGWDSLCPEYKIIGFQVDGGYAEYAKAPAVNAIPVSQALSFEEWAATPLVFLTSWHMLVTRAGLKPGETVLIQAAGSGVGSAAIQIAKYHNAFVITTAGSDEKVAKAKELGADEVINYRARDFVAEVKGITNGRGVDVVFEHIGGETFERSLQCLAKRGRLVTCGATTSPSATIDIRFLYSRQQSIIGSLMGGKKEQRDVIKLLEKGKLRPVVDEVFPLQEAVSAHRKMEERRQFGKLVLRC